ncbi:ATP-binding protein [Thiomonas delicata]|uniref:ORC1/DEAH AAA+ ATPase domain-containing protein n=1 Tax=Thiomonas delicata TaxID=364030 RepID=A0A238D160_THIDL|nr:ATP-binding protein [Thiomonas delicata]SBP86959.1 conserved hypothetical protein [Thiomonas delicata]
MSILQQMLQSMQSNPLVAGLPPRMSDAQLYEKLRVSPITPEDVAEIPIGLRQDLVHVYKQILVPTPQALKIASHIQDMLYTGLHHRDPREERNRRFIFESGSQKGQAIQEARWWASYANGAVIQGITGTGKSHAIDAFLRLHHQVIEHGPNEDAGWRSLKQLVWLKVHMPSDGTRGGFLQGAFLELDKALGENYSEQYKGSNWTVEKRLVVFLHLLAVHRCGLLVIEEAQERNLAVNEYGPDFLTFFLRLLNWGVPTLLIGNPLAFKVLRTFSQDVDRFSESGWFETHPIPSHDNETWKNQWIPFLWLPTLLNEPDEPYRPFSDHPLDQTLEGFIWRRTAGFPRYVSRLRRAVQMHALRCGHRRVTAELVDTVYRSSEMLTPIRPRIEAFVRRDATALAAYVDIPTAVYRTLWAADANPSAASAAAASPRSSPVGGGDEQGQRQGASAKAKARRPSSKGKAQPTGEMNPSDNRSQEWRGNLLASMRTASGADSQ